MTGIVAASAGLFAGRILGQSEIIRPEDSMADLPVYASVTRRIVDDRLTFSGVIKPGPEIPLQIDLDGQEPMVVRQTLRSGDVAEWGSLAAVLSGRPYFLVPGPLPLYRDLDQGDEGDDVLALQRALRLLGYPTSEGGVVDWSTIDAVRDLYASEGFKLDAGRPQASSPRAGGGGAALTDSASAQEKPGLIAFRQFVVLPSQTVKIVAATPAGQRVTSEHPVVKFQIEDNFAEFVADVQQVRSLRVGQTVTVRVAEKQVQGKVATVGPFKEASGGLRAGHLVTVTPANQADVSQFIPNMSVTVLGNGGAEESLAVPLSAIRQDGEGTYVLRMSGTPGNETGEAQRIPVSVVRAGGGFAAVSGEVSVGDRIKLS
ncbi:hypothetical protein [Sinomonas terrae]|uniref:Peptidoglycan binding-like domain-containing protein n=1 Tax=Sinomonas terrae TaxID=2908838 RepID=A0ABS9TZM4_9MICC|nr:hypothetical protein [Sinomonas terrae]MCH6469823.1 hypothetical protein [Sinomonas terrae]